jgi:phytoene dehydrogenase-like protein
MHPACALVLTPSRHLLAGLAGEALLHSIGLVVTVTERTTAGGGKRTRERLTAVCTCAVSAALFLVTLLMFWLTRRGWLSQNGLTFTRCQTLSRA